MNFHLKIAIPIDHRNNYIESITVHPEISAKILILIYLKINMHQIPINNFQIGEPTDINKIRYLKLISILLGTLN